MLATTGKVNGIYGKHVPQGFPIPPEHLLRIQGYRDMDRVRDDVRAHAITMSGRAQQLMRPEAHYRRLRIDRCDDGTLSLEDGVVFHSQELTKAVTECEECVVFVLTLGPQIDEESERLQDVEEIVEALFLETAGWVAMEQATRALAGHLQSLVSDEGLRLARRMGPGYGDWPLQEQSALFELLSGANHKVQLLESCAMVPKKSRSGIYGLKQSA